MPSIRGRLRRTRGTEERAGEDFVEIDPAELSGLFAAPKWLRDAGITSWLLVGCTLLVAGGVWILSLTHVIFLPLVTAIVKISADLSRAEHRKAPAAAPS